MWQRLLMPFVVLVGCFGCDRDHSRKLDRAGKSIDSWRATLNLTAEQWTDGRVPKTYVRQIGDAAEKSLQDEDDALSKIGSDGRAAALRKQVEDLRQRARAISGSATQPSGTEAAGGSGS